jgi:hypothetical protein
MPAAAERAGDFFQSKSKPVDAGTGARFLNDRIPANRFSNAGVQNQ